MAHSAPREGLTPNDFPPVHAVSRKDIGCAPLKPQRSAKDPIQENVAKLLPVVSRNSEAPSLREASHSDYQTGLAVGS